MEPVTQFASHSNFSFTSELVKRTSVLPAIKSGKQDYTEIKTDIELDILLCSLHE